MRVSRSKITNITIDSLIVDSRQVSAYTTYRVVQPSVEIFYAIMKRKNRLDVGFKLGRFFNLEQDDWRNQHQIKIQGLSPIGDYDSYNLALKFLFTFNNEKEE